MVATVLDNRATPLTGIQWLILVTAGIGFAFDMYEIVVQAIVLKPILVQLGHFAPGTPQFNRWAGLMLFLPTTIGGITALLGGYLTDRLGRQRVLVWSIFIYAGAALMSGFATSLPELVFWRCITVAGACVEFVAAIAWLSELFSDVRRRETVLAFAQVCATLGNFMIAGAYYAAVTWSDRLPQIQGGHDAWRYTLLFGALPAIPLMVLRPFLPESPEWLARHRAGTLRRPRIRELLEPRLRRITVITTLLVACCYSLAFGMLQHIPRVVPGIPQVAALPPKQQEQWVSVVHFHVDIGAMAGRLALVGLVIWFVSRRPVLRGLLWAGLALFPFVFLGPALQDVHVFKYAVLAVTLLVGIQYSFWGNYLPRVFPVHLRGTGESFALSFGGRVLAASTALATTQLANYLPGSSPSSRLAHAMALVAVAVTVCALLLSRWLPEPGLRPSDD